MAKLVLLSEGFTGRSHELIADKTTIGRVEDNAFPIPDPSVSSHHCEIFQRGGDILVKDLNSTNGTFIDGEQISAESVVKHGQVLRLGQIQLRLETGAAEVAPMPAKKPIDQTMVMERRGGISLDELEKGPHGAGFDAASKEFSKKSNTVNLYFLIGGIVFAVIIAIALWLAFRSIGKP
jgi:hypothetical protein